MVYEDWMKDVMSKTDGKPEKIPSVIKRCPECNHITLSFDPETYKIRCSHCGFEQVLPKA